MHYIHGCLLTNLKNFLYILSKERTMDSGKKGREKHDCFDKVYLFTSSVRKYKRLHLQIKVSLRLFYFLQIVNSQSIFGLVLSLGGVLQLSCSQKVAVNAHNPAPVTYLYHLITRTVDCKNGK